MSDLPTTKREAPAEKWGIPRYCWLPLCAFLGGSLVFILVDLFAFLMSRLAEHPGAAATFRDMPR